MCCNAPNMMLHCGVRPPRLHHSFTQAGSMSRSLRKYLNCLRAASTIQIARCLSKAVSCSLFFALYVFILAATTSKLSFTAASSLINAGLINCECAAVRRSFIINVVCLYISNSRVSSCRRLAIESDPHRYSREKTAALVSDLGRSGTPLRLPCRQSLSRMAWQVWEYRRFGWQLGGCSSLFHWELYRLSTVWCSWSLPWS